jgi:hypothetical protein
MVSVAGIFCEITDKSSTSKMRIKRFKNSAFFAQGENRFMKSISK